MPEAVVPVKAKCDRYGCLNFLYILGLPLYFIFRNECFFFDKLKPEKLSVKSSKRNRNHVIEK